MSLSSSNIIYDSKTDDVFVETFLIDGNHLNDKGWKVSYDNPGDFDNRVKASLGHPLVLYEKKYSDGIKAWDHPISETGSVTDDIEFQKPYIIGKSVHNKKIRDGLWHSSYKIIHEGAKRFLKSIKESAIDLFTSPYVERDVFDDRQNIRNWSIVHNAIVSTPANGKQLAKVTDICEGDAGSTCAGLFTNSTSETASYYDNLPGCGYCLGDSLKQYVTSHSSKGENASNIMSDGNQQSAVTSTAIQGQGQTSSPNNNTNAEINNNTQQLLQQSEHAPPQEQNDTQKTIAELQDKIKQLEAEKQQSQPAAVAGQTEQDPAVTKKYESRISNLEKQLALKDRTSNIEKMLMQAISMYTDDSTGSINEKEYNADLDRLVQKNYDVEDIQELIQAKFVLHQQATGKLTNNNNPDSSNNSKVGNKASNTSPDYDITSQVSETASTNYTQMNGTDSYTQDNSAVMSQPFVNILNNLSNERFQLRSKFAKGGLV
ncbi:MAG: hypothetical protein L0H53_04470 [Candidatus Nitrosocosmicus sp.]|nr:hypothetical protein [Candidatus Nitrosocosmicus sp.]MDN5866234.1 hypothetical protein [Candidatus Nitrosocosmicus sp.]